MFGDREKPIRNRFTSTVSKGDKLTVNLHEPEDTCVNVSLIHPLKASASLGQLLEPCQCIIISPYPSGLMLHGHHSVMRTSGVTAQFAVHAIGQKKIAIVPSPKSCRVPGRSCTVLEYSSLPPSRQSLIRMQCLKVQMPNGHSRSDAQLRP